MHLISHPCCTSTTFNKLLNQFLSYFQPQFLLFINFQKDIFVANVKMMNDDDLFKI